MDPNSITSEVKQRFGVCEGWHFGMPVSVRWSDIDGFGHVNNLTYFRWFEDCRNAYLSKCGFPLVDATVAGPVIAETNCKYLRALGFEDEVLVAARVATYRERSFRMEYSVWKDGGGRRHSDMRLDA